MPFKYFDMNNFRSGWYLIYTKPRHEMKVHTHLMDLKINSFLPRKKTLRSWHDRKKYVEEPLFPSYVFIYLEDMQAYYEGIHAEGALYYVRTGKEVARMSDTVVNSIRLLVDKNADIEVTSNNFEPGQQLLICQGPLTGLSCEMIRLNGSQRILVRAHLLQRSLLVMLPSHYLMTASSC